MSPITDHEFNATSPAQMRLEIKKLAHSDALVNVCTTMAHKYGLNELDFMTMLAYGALDALRHTQLNYLAELSMSPRPMVVEKAS